MRHVCRRVVISCIAVSFGALVCQVGACDVFDRKATVERIDVRFAAEQAWNKQYGERAWALRKRRKAGEDVAAEMKEIPAAPTFVDLDDEALAVIAADPTDTAAFKAIDVVLNNSMKKRAELALDSPAQQELHARMARILLDNHLKREDFLSVSYVYLSDRKARIAYWEKVYRGSPHPQVRAEAAYRLADDYFDSSGEPDLTPAARANLRRQVQHYGRIIRDEYADTRAAGQVESLLAALNYSVGAVLPNIEVATVAGGRDGLANYRGQVVLLDFWATWCGPCKKSHPDLIALKAEMHGKPFEIIGISADERPEVVARYMTQTLNLPWPQWYVGPNGPLLKAWGVSSYPTYLLVDGNGIVQARGGDSLDSIKDHARRLMARVEHK